MQLHIYESTSQMSLAAAEWITLYITQQLKKADRFTLVLSGGSTPKQLYAILATDDFRDRIDWLRVHIFFGDERFVSFDDDRNNGKMAFDYLLKLVPVPPEQIHYISTKVGEEQSAKEYEQILREYFPTTPPSFDLALLGMGDDGHTLSLFPHSPVIHEEHKWVSPAKAPVEPVDRITLTASIVNMSRCVLFLLAGEGKSQPLHEVLEGEFNPDLYPSQIISRTHNNVHLFADRDATSLLTKHN